MLYGAATIQLEENMVLFEEKHDEETFINALSSLLSKIFQIEKDLEGKY